MKPIGFKALIKKVEIISLESGDKSVRVTLRIDSPEKGLVGKLDDLHSAERLVAVAIAEDKD